MLDPKKELYTLGFLSYQNYPDPVKYRAYIGLQRDVTMRWGLAGR